MSVKARHDDDSRIVVTGLGVVSPIGNNVQETWDSLKTGRIGIREVTAFDTSQLNTHRAGSVEGFVPEEHMPAELAARAGRASHLAIAAVKQAMDQSGIDTSTLNPYRAGVSFGTTMGEPGIFDKILDISVEQSPQDVPPDLWLKLPNHKIANNIAYAQGFKGPNFQIPTACAAGNYAIGYAADLLRNGRVDVMVAGGSDALSRIAFVGFNKLRAMSPDHVRPFDQNRQGMMIGEGAGALVLERYVDAKKRGAHIIAEFLGYGLGCDAFKMSIPHPDGVGGKIALVNALKHARVNPSEIDYVCAHGTGTQENDKIETQVIKEVLGDQAYKCSVNSIKAMIAHCMGASSAIEAVSTCLTLQHGIIPPTLNYETPDPLCDLDYVPNEARERDVQIAASNAYAFGGNDSTLIFQKFA